MRLPNWLDHFFLHSRIKSPRQQFRHIFDAVQTSRLFPDSKTFVDSVPLGDRKSIMRAYRNAKKKSPLAEFIREHFMLPEMAIPSDPEDSESARDIRRYIARTWHNLTRGPDRAIFGSSLLPLPRPYVVAGGRFREIYYWDSYFTMLGLRESGEIELLENTVANFAHLVTTYGFIPNSNRSYHLSRSQPPFFSLMVELLADVRGPDVYRTYLPAMVQEYTFWMRGKRAPRFSLHASQRAEHVVRMPGGEILNRYYDTTNLPREESFYEDIALQLKAPKPRHFFRNMRAAAESGWDFSSRWFVGDGLETTATIEFAPVDLNALFVKVEEIIASASEICGDSRRAVRFRNRRAERIAALQRYFWNEDVGWFMDYHLSEKRQSPHLTLAGMFPLYTGVATATQAARAAKTLREKFLRPGGVTTTLVKSGEQWDIPNGWAPLQYITIIGLERYGYHDLARDIARRWCTLVMSHFAQDGTLLEKYNIEDPSIRASGGEYEVQQGFGWTNGVTLTLMNKYEIH